MLHVNAHTHVCSCKYEMFRGQSLGLGFSFHPVVPTDGTLVFYYGIPKHQVWQNLYLLSHLRPQSDYYKGSKKLRHEITNTHGCNYYFPAIYF